jgi:predicted ATP-dependent endonuclease of OLD family
MTYHLEKLSIHAFRQLRDVTFHDLGRVNLLVGVNNSGKTSVLEAIAAHCRPLDPLKWIAIARQREVRSSREPDLDSLRWLFPQHQAESDDPYYQGEIRISGYGSYANLEN